MARIAPVPQVIRGGVPADAAKGAEHFAGRQWVIDQIANWANTSTERFLIVVGEPGWGKSTLAAWLVGPEPDAPKPHRRIPRPPVTWNAWHFCSSRQTRTIDPQQLSASLALQLASQFPEYNDVIVKKSAPEISVTIRADTISGTAIGIQTLTVNAKGPQEVYDAAVLQPLEVVARGREAPIFILIDGLDDSLEFASPTIVDLVAGSGDLPDSVRFLVTTRNERRVLTRFSGAFDASQFRTLYVSDPDDSTTVKQNDTDVGDYVKAELRGQAAALKTGVRANDVAAAVVDAANGNFLVARFLLDQVARTGALPDGIPRGLYPIYDDYLRRVMPETTRAGISREWRNDYQPLLGALTVARPAAPSALIPKWLGRNEGELNPVLTAVGQLVEQLDDDGGSRRLYHRTLAEYLALADVPGVLGDSEPNRYFVDPLEQHQRIVTFYLASLKKQWGGDWSKADGYGLRQLIPHLFALHRLTTDSAERARIAAQLCDIALDDAFQAAQRDQTGDAAATIEACRLAIEASLESETLDVTRERVRRLADSWEPQIRILAARLLARLSESDRAAVLADLRALVK